jgi:hypothetical protein
LSGDEDDDKLKRIGHLLSDFWEVDVGRVDEQAQAYRTLGRLQAIAS